MSLRSVALAAAFLAAGFPGAGGAQTAAPTLLTSDALVWRSTPLMPGIEAATVVGAQDKPGLYVFRVRMAPGARIPPHTHPDERNVTILSGTLWIGIGETADAATMTPVSAGAVFIVPAGTPHYVASRDGAVIYQESGTGPSRTTVIQR